MDGEDQPVHYGLNGNVHRGLPAASSPRPGIGPRIFDSSPMREPWDYETFIRHYDAIARERGGWRFDREGYTPPEKLEAWYREGGALFDSLYDFTRTRFMLEQQM